MPGKHYKKLGKTKLVRVPEKTEGWIKAIVRKLDEKEDPEKFMEFLSEITDRTILRGKDAAG